MKAYTYIKQGEFGFTEKEKPAILDDHDAIVRVTLSSICTSDLHIKHGSVPRAVPGITVGHEMVGIVDEVGKKVTNVKPGDRLGLRMPHRRWTNRIRQGSLRHYRTEQDS